MKFPEVKNQGKDSAWTRLREKITSGEVWLELWAFLLKVCWVSIIILVLFVFVVGVTSNSGDRMVPALQNRDLICYYRLAKDLKSGEVVVYCNEDGESVSGRIVAVPGDSVDITEDGVKINGYYREDDLRFGETPLFSKYVSFPLTLNQGEYFILCDNRETSDDSRTMGPLKIKQIRGRLLFVLRHRDF